MQDIDLQGHCSLADFVQHYCKQYQDLIAFESFGVRLTFAELEEKSLQIATYLQQTLSLKKGDRFAIMLPNILQFPIVLYAALRAGLIVVNINPLYTARELMHQLNNSGAKAIIVLENFADTVAEALPLAPNLHHVIVTKTGDCLPGLKGHLINIWLKYIDRKVPQYHIDSVIYYADIVKKHSGKTFQKPQIAREDLAFLQYTGGTTGIAKAAMLTQHNVLANLFQCLDWLGSQLHAGKDTLVMPLPLYHIFSLTCSFFCLASGIKAVLVANPRDINRFVKLLRRNRFEIFMGLNTLFNALMNHPEFKKIDFSNLRLVFSGGMALQESVARRWRELAGVTILEGYGLTEASPVVAINPVGVDHFTGALGMAVKGTEVSIRDENDKLLAPGEKGELWVRGPQIMKGYWNDPDETAKIITPEGWLKTGDIVYMDDDKLVYLVDRKKDIIIVSGFNVYPNEIERVLMSHPGIAEAAVIGVPSEKTGEAVKAFVVLDAQESVSKEAIIDFCNGRLTNYKTPKQIEFCDTLPKSSVGKVLRKSLRVSA